MLFGRRCHTPGFSKHILFLGLVGLCGLLADMPSAGAQGYPPEADAQTLRSSGVTTTADGLLEFFRQRTLSQDDSKQIEEYIKQQDSTSLVEREKAAKALVLRGQVALPYLQKAVNSGSLEARLRVKTIIQQIEKVSSPDVEAAAVRYLAHLKPKGTLDVLMKYYSSAAEDWVRNEVLVGLGKVGAQNGKVDPLLLNALEKSP